MAKGDAPTGGGWSEGLGQGGNTGSMQTGGMGQMSGSMGLPPMGQIAQGKNPWQTFLNARNWGQQQPQMQGSIGYGGGMPPGTQASNQLPPQLARLFQAFSGGGQFPAPQDPRIGLPPTNRTFGAPIGRFGGYTMNNQSPWGYQQPTPNRSTVAQPTPAPDTSEHPK